MPGSSSQGRGADNGEFYLPEAINDLVDAGEARVRVLSTDEDWFGVTYREDLEGSLKADSGEDRRRGLSREALDLNPSSQSTSYRMIVGRAWPIIVANSAGPLLGLTDTAVIGRTGSVASLGAIALGSLIFSFVYWTFGFLRMSTTGFVAQANGSGDEVEVRSALGRATLMGLVIGLGLIALQVPIFRLALALIDGSAAVETTAATYLGIRIWGAPATLASYALMGGLIGLGRSRTLLGVQIFMNALNIGLDILFAGYPGHGRGGDRPGDDHRGVVRRSPDAHPDDPDTEGAASGRRPFLALVPDRGCPVPGPNLFCPDGHHDPDPDPSGRVRLVHRSRVRGWVT